MHKLSHLAISGCIQLSVAPLSTSIFPAFCALCMKSIDIESIDHKYTVCKFALATAVRLWHIKNLGQ